MAGVRRKPLARSEDQVHVTSIVEYAANSYFSEHSHPQGEEIFVLEGIFSDQDRDPLPAVIYATHLIVNMNLLASLVVLSSLN